MNNTPLLRPAHQRWIKSARADWHADTPPANEGIPVKRIGKIAAMPNLRISEQVVIGLWAAGAAAIGIVSRSAALALSVLALGTLVCAPMLAVHGLRSRSAPMQWLSRAVIGAALAVIAVAVLGTIERVYLVSADTYPRWLASGELGGVDDTELLRLRETACKAAPIEIFQKRDFVVLRCGFALYEPSTRTYVATSFHRGTER